MTNLVRVPAKDGNMSLGPLELAMIAAIALLFFGPSKLPQLGKSIGEAIRGFKGAMNDMNEEINRPENNSENKSAKKPDAPPPQKSDSQSSETTQEESKKEKDPVH